MLVRTDADGRRGQGLKGLSSPGGVSKFLDAPEEDVLRLLDEGRLGGVLIAELRQRGVKVTPQVKNSVQSIVHSVGEWKRAKADAVDSQLRASEATATILFTDLVDSTRIVDQLGDRAAGVVMGVHNSIVRYQAAAYRGAVVKSMGDGFMLTFPSARSGVACAVDIQRDLARRNSAEDNVELSVRMGLTVGEPMRDNADLFGRSVIIASRISALADGDQVLVSQVVHDLTAGTGEFEFKKLGSFPLKGISEDQTIYDVIWRDL